MKITIKRSKNYDLFFDERIGCFVLLEFERRMPHAQGYAIAQIPKDELIDLIAENYNG